MRGNDSFIILLELHNVKPTLLLIIQACRLKVINTGILNMLRFYDYVNKSIIT